MWRSIVVLAIGCWLGFGAVAQEKRVALLIGNEAYGTRGLSVLVNPHEDIDRVAAALKQVGFDVEVVKDQNEAGIRRALQDFRDELTAGGEDAVGFFYYSGHGASVDQGPRRVSYMIPVGNPVEYADDLEIYGVEIQREIELLQGSGAGAVIVVIDACRNTLTRRNAMGGAATKGIGAVSAPPGLLIAFSAADGQFADDDSVFSTALATEIVKPGQSAETAFTNVARAVGAAKGSLDRLPVIQPRLSKQLCFSACVADDDERDWRRLSALGLFDAYVQLHPGGRYVGEARRQVAARPAVVAVSVDETETQKTAAAYDRGMRAYEEKDFETARREFSVACPGGNAMSCGLLGFLTERGLGGPKDEAEARDLYLRSCEGGVGFGCFNMGIMLSDGVGGAEDPILARNYLQRGCDADVAAACGKVAYMYSNGRGGPKDPARAVEMYQRACDGGDAHSCNNLGWLYQTGVGIVKDESQARQLYELGCDDGSAMGCVNLGNLYATGLGVAKDDSFARELYRRGCDMGADKGCGNLGIFMLNGRGGDENAAEGARLLRVSCAGGNQEHCDSLDRRGLARQ